MTNEKPIAMTAEEIEAFFHRACSLYILTHEHAEKMRIICDGAKRDVMRADETEVLSQGPYIEHMDAAAPAVSVPAKL